MISQALQNAQSQDEVVLIINNGGTSDYNSSEIAGQYAWDAARDQDDTSDNNIEAMLDLLVEAGANFDLQEAMKTAQNIKKD